VGHQLSPAPARLVRVAVVMHVSFKILWALRSVPGRVAESQGWLAALGVDVVAGPVVDVLAPVEATTAAPGAKADLGILLPRLRRRLQLA